MQARQSAYEWHGRLWSPFLYCYASLGCRIANDEFKHALINEIEHAMRTVEANGERYERDEPAKLRNLQKCVEAGQANWALFKKAERRNNVRVESTCSLSYSSEKKNET